MLPGLVALAAGDRTIVPFIVALWLVLPCLRLEKAAMAEFIFNQMVGYERLGAALDLMLAQVDADHCRQAACAVSHGRHIRKSNETCV